MIIETKKTFLILSLLFAVAVPFNRVNAAIGPLCGGNEDQYIKELHSVREDTAADRTARQQERTKRTDDLKNNMCQLKDIFSGTVKVINYLVGFIGVFIVFRIVVSGFQMVIAAGNEGMLKTAKAGLQNSILGLVLVLLSYVIVNTVFEVFDVNLGLEDEIKFPYNPFNP